jgi:hypothetical protein
LLAGLIVVSVAVPLILPIVAPIVTLPGPDTAVANPVPLLMVAIAVLLLLHVALLVHKVWLLSE